MSTAQEITIALDGRWYGSYGLAFCPAHDNRRTPALTLADGDGGRLLAHCKAGCSFADVAAALRERSLSGLDRPIGGADQETARVGDGFADPAQYLSQLFFVCRDRQVARLQPGVGQPKTQAPSHSLR